MPDTKFHTITLEDHKTLHDMLVEIQYHLQSDDADTIREFVTPHGEKFGVSPLDNDGEIGDYYIVGHTNLPTDIYAEIEDGTYGELQGWRIYV